MNEDFFHLPHLSTTLVAHLELENLREFSKNFETALMVYSGAWGKLIHEKNQKSKILWHCPFKKLEIWEESQLKILQLIGVRWDYCMYRLLKLEASPCSTENGASNRKNSFVYLWQTLEAGTPLFIHNTAKYVGYPSPLHWSSHCPMKTLWPTEEFISRPKWGLNIYFIGLIGMDRAMSGQRYDQHETC